MKNCQGKKAPEGEVIDDYAHGINYLLARVRYLLALWCSRCHRPFAIVEDPELHVLLCMLYPKVEVPSRKTVSRDVRKIVEDACEHVKAKLLGLPGKVYICVDGWTSPNVIAFLDVTVHWQEGSKIQHLILDFIKYVCVLLLVAWAQSLTLYTRLLDSRRLMMARTSVKI